MFLHGHLSWLGLRAGAELCPLVVLNWYLGPLIIFFSPGNKDCRLTGFPKSKQLYNIHKQWHTHAALWGGFGSLKANHMIFFSKLVTV